MAALPPTIKQEFDRLCASGDELVEDRSYDESLTRYERAWALLPDPKEQWDDFFWILAAIGDAHFFRGDFPAGLDVFMRIMRSGGSPDNPYFRLRLGQCLLELGQTHEAANWLAGAFLLGGGEVFGEDDPKYLEFVKSQLDAPPGGWPENF